MPTAAALRDAVLSAAPDPAVARRSRELADELRAAGGTRRAADIIESYVS
jgi:UDP:flavonoid glycosyltransferase YjiC (YdhE family)